MGKEKVSIFIRFGKDFEKIFFIEFFSYKEVTFFKGERQNFCCSESMVFFRRVLKDEDIIEIINLSYERTKTRLLGFLAKGTIRSGHGQQIYHLFRSKTNRSSNL